MEDFIILSPGQRLRKLRKKLGMTQAELASDNISKNYISMFENEKRPINVINATYLAEAINQKAKEKNIDIFIKPSYFIKNERDIAREMCLEIIEEVSQNQMNKYSKYKNLYKAIYISSQYGFIDLLAQALEFKGKTLFREGLYFCAMTHLSKSLLYYFQEGNKEGIYNCYLAIGQIHFMDENYEAAIAYFNLASAYGNEDNILYYRALCHYKLGHYKIARNIIDKIIFKDERVLKLEKNISNIV